MDFTRSVRPAAEAAYLAYLEQLEAGASPDFEGWCARHPEYASEMRRLNEVRDWLRNLTLSGESQATRVTSVPSGFRTSAPAPENDRTVLDEAPAARLYQSLRERGEGHVRYHYRGEVGRGGMGAVLRVFDGELRRALAMKVALGQSASEELPLDEAGLLRFLEEAQITAQLEHPGIVPVHALGVDPEGRVYFTMRLVEGRSLGDVLRDLKTSSSEEWSVGRMARVLLRICDAVGYAHEKGVVHRDLKPGNVMLGRFGEVYVMDWGLAKVLTREGQEELVSTERGISGSAFVTDRGLAVGTPVYMAPEQARGEPCEASDQYSIGAILYRYLTGRAPYTQPGRSTPARAVLARLLGTAPVPVEELAPSAPPELVAICEKAMARDPEQRYGSVRELGLDLEAFLEGRVVRAHRRGPWIELVKWTRRNRALAAALVGLVLALTLGLLASTALTFRARESSRRADEAARVSREVVDFLVGMFDSGMPDSARGERVLVKDVIGTEARRVLEEWEGEPSVRLELAHSLARVHGSLGLWREALPLIELAGDLARDVHGLRSDEAFEVQLSQGRYLTQAGDHAGARTVLEELRAEVHLALGEDSELAWRIEGRLAHLLMEEGHLQEAEVELRRAVDGLRGVGGEANAFDAYRADLLRRLGRYKEAEAETLLLLEVFLEQDGPEHSNTLRTEHGLATILVSQGRRDEADTLLAAVEEKALRVMGPEHPLTLTVQGSRARILFDRRAWDAAGERLEACLGVSRRVLGPEHEDTLLLVQNLAAVERRRGNPDLAEDLYREALAGYEGALAPDHPRVLGLCNNLALVLAADPKRAVESEELYRRSLEGRQRVLGEDHPDTLNVQTNLAKLLSKVGQGAEAIELLERALEHFAARGDTDTAAAGRTRQALAGVYEAGGGAEQAIALLEARVEELRAGDPVPLVEALEELAGHLTRAHQRGRAAAVLAELLDLAPVDHPRRGDWEAEWERLEFGE